MRPSVITSVITTAIILAVIKSCYAQGCEPIQFSGCMGQSYSQTSFPNLLQWPDQDTALQNAPYVFPTYNSISDCHPDLISFLCSAFFPQCTSEGQILPCRSFCNEIDAACGNQAQAAGAQWESSLCNLLPESSCSRPNAGPTTHAATTPIAATPTQRPSTNAGCEPIQYSGCMGLSYSQTSFPNLYQWPSQSYALQTAPYVLPTYDPISDCHPDLDFFLCSLFFPQCTSEGQIFPCRSFCNEIDAACTERALAAGVEWDASLCTQLPEDSCSLPNAPGATTPAGTATRGATARIAVTTTQRPSITTMQCTGYQCFVSGECISYVKFCNGVADCADGTDELPQLCRSDEPLGVCQPITPSAEFICTHLLPYENTSLPNYLNQTTQTASLQTAFALNRASGCHPSFTFLMCTTLFPMCEDGQQTPPCRELCDEVRASCEAPLQAIGEEWPRSCTDLPSRDDKECLEPTPGACEPFPQSLQSTCELLTEYNSTSFPNAFGHLSFQEMITSREYFLFGSVLGNISTSCYPNVYTAFCRMFLPQCEKDTQIQLCRSACEEINARCSPVGLGLPFSCDVFPDQNVDSTCSAVEKPTQCEPIRYSRCIGLPYSQTSFPNIYQWPTQDIALQAAPSLFPTYDNISDCHPDFNFFLCSLFFPQCTSGGQIFPCRSFCYEINATCGERALAAGVQWDASICTQLSEDSCSGPNVPTTPAGTTIHATTAPIAANTTQRPSTANVTTSTTSAATTNEQSKATVGATSGGGIGTGGIAGIIIGVLAAIALAASITI